MQAAIRQAYERVSALFRGATLDSDLNKEFELHLELAMEDNVRRGMTKSEAERTARLQLGGVTQVREAHRDARGIPFLETLARDLRYTLRTLRRDISFTTLTILIAGLGIGASCTVFSVVSALLIRPLPFHDPGQLVWVANSGNEGDLSGQTVTVGSFVDLRDQTKSMSDIAAWFAFYGTGDRKLTGSGDAERLTAVPVSYNFFPLLGVHPQAGRLFTAEECKGNRPDAVLLSAGFWKRHFASDPRIVGQTLTLNDQAFRVVGVMPPSFDFASVFAPGSQIDLFVPLPLTPEVDRQGNTLTMIGRLKPGVTLSQAQAEARVLSEPIRMQHSRGQLLFTVASLEEHISGHFRPALFVLGCAVGVVMLILCANLSNLQLARAAARQQEMAIRVALGAGRSRLIGQMLTESMVLCCGAALLGLALAIVGTRLLAHLDAISLPLLTSVRVDGWAVAFAVTLAGLTGLIFGLVPAFQVPGFSFGSLKDSGRGSTEGKNHHWIRKALVVSEITFACVLLTAAGLLIRSFLRVLDVDPGFRPRSAAALRVDPDSRYSTRVLRNTYFDDVLHRVRAVPGIQVAGLTDVLPLGHNRSWGAGAKDKVYSTEHQPPDAFVRIVTDGYLDAMGISLRMGRDLSEHDNASSKPVILINETLAHALWPDRNPLGQTVTFIDVDREVVGIVGDVRHVALEQGSGGEMYIPMRQIGDYVSVELVVRSQMPPAALASAVRTAIRPIEPNLPRNEFRTLQELVDKAVSPRRFFVVLLAGFSAFALILASLGIYAVVSYSVSQRTREIGIRMALGASAEDLQTQIVLQTLGMAAVGILIGLILSWVMTRALSGLLFETTPTDPATFLGMVAVLTLVAGAAGYFPARRASRIDPLTALRVN
jgi:predicted permease